MVSIGLQTNSIYIYINFVQLSYQFLSTKCFVGVVFRAIVLPLFCASLDLWGCRLSSKRGSFSHGGLILCSVLIQKFVHYFFTVNWVVASFVCNEDDIINKVYYILEFLMQRSPFKTYLNPLQCYIISLQQRYTRLFICLYSFIYLLIQRYSSICDNCLSKKSEFR